ncbi:hypothetical protein AVEN_171883-1 [Araneus ventricosus]|uniref:Uncharacterized protein n=1 Tax=Araneus ventricosus TaxID=182803 RepID=A0A4Y2SBR1_ARAVE|nr:hypothetical protein AVEN_171883-1 [Araneus ventricosus]
MGIIKKDNQSVRIRSINRIYEGGLRIAVADDEIRTIKTSLENENIVTDRFELYTPRKRKPQIIIYNAEKELEDQEVLLKELLTKTVFLANKRNESPIKNFKIHSRTQGLITGS